MVCWPTQATMPAIVANRSASQFVTYLINIYKVNCNPLQFCIMWTDLLIHRSDDKIRMHSVKVGAEIATPF